MSTTQMLTTEQVEIMMLIDAINEYEEINGRLEVPMSETIDGCIATEDRCVNICERLKYYGYVISVDNGYALTIDGKQYIDLFNDYLAVKANNPQAVHNSYSLINIEKMQLDLEPCLAKLSVSLPKFSFSTILKKIGQLSKDK